jgi:GYD domain
MLTFMLSLNWTDQGIRKVKDAPKRNKAAKELAKKVGIEIKHVYLTSGDDSHCRYPKWGQRAPRKILLAKSLRI